MQLLTRLDKSLGRCDIIITDKSIKNAISFIKESQVQMEGLLGPWVTLQKEQGRLKRNYFSLLLSLALSPLGILSSGGHLYSNCCLCCKPKSHHLGNDLQLVKLMANGNLGLLQPKLKADLINYALQGGHLHGSINDRFFIALFKCFLRFGCMIINQSLLVSESLIPQVLGFLKLGLKFMNLGPSYSKIIFSFL